MMFTREAKVAWHLVDAVFVCFAIFVVVTVMVLY